MIEKVKRNFSKPRFLWKNTPSSDPAIVPRPAADLWSNIVITRRTESVICKYGNTASRLVIQVR